MKICVEIVIINMSSIGGVIMLTEFIAEVISYGLDIYGIVVVKDGIKIAEHHFVPEERREMYSVTKSFTSTAVGISLS